MMILNLTKNNVIAKKTVVAEKFAARAFGMIGRRFDDFDAMVFNRCNSIHTMFMSIKIDVLFVDSENRICETRERLLPWKPLVRCSEATIVIELPEGRLEQVGAELGDTIDLNAELTLETELKLHSAIIQAPETAIPLKQQVD
ncbi:MAG: hypothetical protein GXP32_03660 [Kiritimatiellaeota bacterium]|nr:hypothetical protein [Kiritimatiellota bacterium]